MQTLIQGGVVVNADGQAGADSQVGADVLVTDGVISAVEPGIQPAGDCRVLDATGCYVIPGGIDPHTHLEMPAGDIRTADTFEQGGRAALAGGTTMVIDFVNAKHGQSYLEALDQGMARARDATCDYSFHATITWFDEAAEEQLRELATERGVNSFKHFTTYRGNLMLEPEKMLASFALARELGCLPTVHAENDEIIVYLQQKLLARGIGHPKGHALSRPPIAEGEATHRAIVLAGVAGAPLYVVHMSCAEALAAVTTAQEAGQEVHAESLAGHLLLDEDVYFTEDAEIAARYVMSPPYRTREHREALWQGLSDGRIKVTGSDNCTYMQAQKNRGLTDFTKIPNGSAGLEDRLRILWSEGVAKGRLTPEQFVAVTSTNAAKIFNIHPRKGVIAPGADADIVLWDPQAKHTVSAATHRQATDYSVFEGMTFTGSPRTTLLAGEVVFAQGEVTARAGQGRYIPRPARPSRSAVPPCHS